MRPNVRYTLSVLSLSALTGCQTPPPSFPSPCQDQSKAPLTHDALRLLTPAQVKTVQVYAAQPFELRRWLPPPSPQGHTVPLTTARPEMLEVQCLKPGMVTATRSYGRANDVLYVSFGPGSPDIPFDNAPHSSGPRFGDQYWLRHNYLDGGTDDAGPQFEIVDEYASYLLVDKPTAATSLPGTIVLPGRSL